MTDTEARYGKCLAQVGELGAELRRLGGTFDKGAAEMQRRLNEKEAKARTSPPRPLPFAHSPRALPFAHSP